MKEAEINKGLESLQEFESLEAITPSGEWTRSLMGRLSDSGVSRKPDFESSRVALVLILFILANVGILLTFITDGSRQSTQRETELRAISNEFLINPTSISL